MKLCLLYTTFSDRKEAEKIAQQLVENKLSACCNISNQMMSVFFWQEKVSQEKEFFLLVKTLPSLVDKCTDFILANHSYDVPCILSMMLPVNEEFFNWANKQLLD